MPAIHETFIVVGGGIIGLTTAYQLAATCRSLDRSCRIVVLDAATSLWDTSAHYNTGGISGFHPSGPRHEISVYSYNMLRALSNDDEFRRMTCIKDHTTYTVSQDGHAMPENLPGWVNAKSEWKLRFDPEDGSSMMILDSATAFAQCHNLGVEIVHDAKVIKVAMQPSGRVEALHYSQNDTEHTLCCNHVIFAAGAWTPSLIKDLFPYSFIDLRSDTDGLNWMIIRNPDSSSQHIQITFELSALLKEGSLELAAREDGTIFVTGVPGTNKHLPPFVTTGVFDVDEDAIERFRVLLRRFVRQFADGTAEIEVIKQGLSYRPSNSIDRPIIAALPSNMMNANGRSQGQVSVDKSGLYVSTGHGYYGITECLGSAKLISALALGIEPEIDIRCLGLP